MYKYQHVIKCCVFGTLLKVIDDPNPQNMKFPISRQWHGKEPKGNVLYKKKGESLHVGAFRDPTGYAPHPQMASFQFSTEATTTAVVGSWKSGKGLELEPKQAIIVARIGTVVWSLSDLTHLTRIRSWPLGVWLSSMWDAYIRSTCEVRQRSEAAAKSDPRLDRPEVEAWLDAQGRWLYKSPGLADKPTFI